MIIENLGAVLPECKSSKPEFSPEDSGMKEERHRTTQAGNIKRQSLWYVLLFFPVLLGCIGAPMRPHRPQKIIQSILMNIFVNHFKTDSKKEIQINL